MPKFNSRRRVNHSSAQMFDLVADVERYPEFVPLCNALKMRQRVQKSDDTEVVIAEMTVSFKLVRETFTTRVTLDRTNLEILVEYLQGPFSATSRTAGRSSRNRTHRAMSGSISPTNSRAACWRC